MTKEKLLETLSVKLALSNSTKDYHNDNYHFYRGRSDALNEVLKELSESEVESEKGEQKNG